jgi:hypothetical protein
MATKQEKDILQNVAEFAKTRNELDRQEHDLTMSRLGEIERQIQVFQLLSADVATSLRTIAGFLAPLSPNYKRPFETWKNFNWDDIGAKVMQFDEFGPSVVSWNAHHFKRRSGNGKFGRAVWFSRGIGKTDNGAEYAILIRFRKESEPEPLQNGIEPAAPPGPQLEPQLIAQLGQSGGKQQDPKPAAYEFFYEDGTAVPENTATRALFSAFFDANGFVPAHSDMLREWYKQRKRAADAEAEEE